ncbi:BAI1-associated protein 3-like [Lethenteron reissneri]|uniref:BAI1-associated protein 3-like n=1 Tax=Lethenteron reissneri TaxID=7753 RepID=UPI002AB7D037|nr:BAI1-associated protein 3-like [Lethenteron reissneri]XP_061411528.1 BAI1-associated protein 3-like [Lethenteron reissneri]
MDKSNQINQDLLYEDVLYTLVHQPDVKKKPTHTKELLWHLQKVFDKSASDHESILKKVESAEAPTFSLKVTVNSAHKLEPKDTDGTNSPYCTLGIVHGVADASKKTEEDMLFEADLLEKTNRQQKTLEPVWNETFLLEVESMQSDLFCLYIWSHHQSSMVKQLRRVNSLAGVRNMGKIVIRNSLKARTENVDVFLGRLCLPLKGFPCGPHEMSYKLQPRSRKSTVRGDCKLTTAFVVESQSQRCTGLGKVGVSRLQTYRGLLEVLLNWEVQQQAAVHLGEASARLLTQLAQQANLSAQQRNLAAWTVYSRHTQRKELDYLLKLLRDINGNWEKGAVQDLEGDLQRSFRDFTAVATAKLRDLEKSFPLSQPESLAHLKTLLECLGEAFTCRGNMDGTAPAAGLAIQQALAEGAECWYNEKRAPISSEKSTQEHLDSLVGLCEEMNNHLQSSPYSKLFTDVASVNINATRYQVLEKLVAADVSSAMRSFSELDVFVADIIHRLYTAVQGLHQLGTQLLDRKALEATLLSSFHEWFHSAIHDWLLVCFRKSRKVTSLAVEKDSLKTESSSVDYSSSAFDTVSWFTNMRKFWLRLAWPDSKGSIGLAMRIIKDIFGTAQYYVEMMETKLKQQVCPPSNGGQFLLSVEVCTALNSVQHVRAVLHAIPEQWELDPTQWVDGASGEEEEEERCSLGKRLQGYHDDIREVADNLFDWVTELILSDLKKSLNDGCDLEAVAMGVGAAGSAGSAGVSAAKRAEGKRDEWSAARTPPPPQSPTREAAMPLLDKLDINLKILHENVSKETFQSILASLWHNIVDMFSKGLHENVEHTKEYYKKIHNVLEALKQMVIADGHGLPADLVHSKECRDLERKLNVLRCDTKQLICLYLQEMGNKAPEAASQQATITVQCSYSRRSLVVSILNVKNLSPPEKASAPEMIYIQARMCPPHVFLSTSKMKTSSFKQDTSLIIDETIRFEVDEEQARNGSSCLLLRVKNKSTLLTDVLGEAVLLMSTVPGVCADGRPQGQRSLLLWPHNYDSDILAVLDKRMAEEESRDFLQALGRLESPARSSVRRITQRSSTMRNSIRILKSKAFKR